MANQEVIYIATEYFFDGQLEMTKLIKQGYHIDHVVYTESKHNHHQFICIIRKQIITT